MKLITVLFLITVPFSFSQSVVEIDLSSYGKLGSTALHNGTVYACIERIGDETEQYSGILAVDPASGAEIWFHRLPRGEASYEMVPFGIQLYSNRIYVKVTDLGILCLDADSGEELFLQETSSRIHAPLILDSGFLYGAATSEVFKLDAFTGELIWSCRIETTEEGIPQSVSHIFLDETGLYTGCIQSTMRCLDVETGLPVWFRKDPWLREGDGWLETEYASENLIFVGTSAAETTILEAASGNLLSYLKGCRFLAGDGDGIYLHRTAEDGSCICLYDPDTGTEIDRASTDPCMLNSLEITEEYLVANCHQGELRVFSRSDSAVLGDEIFSRKLSTESISLTLHENRVFAASEDGIVFSASADGSDSWLLETGFVFDEPIRADEGILVIPSEYYLYIIEYI